METVGLVVVVDEGEEVIRRCICLKLDSYQFPHGVNIPVGLLGIHCYHRLTELQMCSQCLRHRVWLRTEMRLKQFLVQSHSLE